MPQAAITKLKGVIILRETLNIWGSLKRRIEPNIKEIRPLKVKTPKVGVKASTIKNIRPKIIKANPAQFTGSMEKAYKAKTKQIIPAIPGKPKPGWVNSKINPKKPKVNNK